MTPPKEVPQKETNKPLHLSKPLAGQGDAAGRGSVRVGSLHPGDYFRTVHTKRLGVILDEPAQSLLLGILSALERPDEEKWLHPDVVVLRERA